MPAREAPGVPLVEARALTVVRDGRPVLSEIDIDVHAGEVVVLVGPNGSGKSTLLGALSGDLTASAGQVLLGGQRVGARPPGDLARRRAFLTQQHTVGFPFTVEAIVRMGRAPWGGTAAADADDEVVVAAMAATEVGALRARSFVALSGGERARVMLARVLAQQAQLLMLDEPTAALDLHHQEVVHRLVRERAAAGDGVLLVLHDLGAAAAVADRVVVLHGGRHVCAGPPASVLTPRTLSAVYQHDVDVLSDPRSGALVVVPRRLISRQSVER